MMHCSICPLLDGAPIPRFKREDRVFCRNPWFHGIVIGCVYDIDNIWYYVLRSSRANIYYLAEDKLELAKVGTFPL